MEPTQLAALVGREDSKIAGIATNHSGTEMNALEPPTVRDGFAATSFLYGATALLARAYSAANVHEYFRMSERHTDAQILEHRQTLQPNSSSRRDPVVPTSTGDRSTRGSMSIANASRPRLARNVARKRYARSARFNQRSLRKPLPRS